MTLISRAVDGYMGTIGSRFIRVYTSLNMFLPALHGKFKNVSKQVEPNKIHIYENCGEKVDTVDVTFGKYAKTTAISAVSLITIFN